MHKGEVQLPAIYFLYDLSPIMVTIKDARGGLAHLLVRICAVEGGVFAITGEAHVCIRQRNVDAKPAHLPGCRQLFCQLFFLLLKPVSYKLGYCCTLASLSDNCIAGMCDRWLHWLVTTVTAQQDKLSYAAS